MDTVTTQARTRKKKPKVVAQPANGVVEQTTLRDLIGEIPEKRLILHNISWEFYEQLLKEFENSNGLHFAFNDGVLEIEMPTLNHDSRSEILSDLVKEICGEFEIDFRSIRSTTLREKLKAKGIEADAAFYIENEAQMRGKLELDLQKDPPPDLAIEVDVTHGSLDKMPIYAALGVPEVWLYEGERIVFQKLVKGKYKEIERSSALPVLTSAKATEFLEKGLVESSSVWFRTVREWARAQKT